MNTNYDKALDKAKHVADLRERIIEIDTMTAFIKRIKDYPLTKKNERGFVEIREHWHSVCLASTLHYSHPPMVTRELTHREDIGVVVDSIMLALENRSDKLKEQLDHLIM